MVTCFNLKNFLCISCKISQFYLRMTLFYLHFWNVSLLDIKYLVDFFFLCAPWICYLLLLASAVSQEKSTVILLVFPCKWWVIFLLLLSKFLSLTFSTFLWHICGFIWFIIFWKFFQPFGYPDKSFSINVGNFQPLFLQIFFCFFLSPFFLALSLCTYLLG